MKGDPGAPGKDGVGLQGPQGDKGLNWRGAYDGRVTYVPDDAVESNGSSYVAVAPVRGVTPPGTGWNLLAQRGQPGVGGGFPGSSGGGLRLEVEGVRIKAAALDLRGPGVSVVSDGTVAHATFSGTGGGPGDAVDSVNGQIGVVVLDAGDVGADVAGAAAAAQAASQPLASDLTDISALTTTTFGRSLLEVADIAGLVALLQPYFLEPD